MGSKSLAITQSPTSQRPQRGDTDDDLRKVEIAGWTLIGIQLIAMLTWSYILYQHYALTADFAQYHQAWYEIAHGNFNPFDTWHGSAFPFLANDSELILYPLAILGFVPHSGFLFLATQDLAAALISLIALRWVMNLVREGRWPSGTLKPAATCWFALSLLLLNPWVYGAISFDWHVEEIGTLFLLLCAKSFYDNSRRLAAFWSVLVLLCGLPMVAALAALGIGLAIFLSRYRRAGVILAASAFLWLVLASLLGGGAGGAGTGGTAVGYLAASGSAPVSLSAIVTSVIEHPTRLIKAWWQVHLDTYGFLAGSGLIGIASPWAFGVTIAVLAETALFGTASLRGFAAVPMQNFPIYALMAVGAVFSLRSLAQSLPRPRVMLGIMLALVLNSLSWFVIWTPTLASTWLRVNGAQANELKSIEGMIPRSSEVIISQGVAGRFSGRVWVYPFSGPGSTPIETRPLWVVIAPTVGIELAPVHTSEALITELAGPLHAQLVSHSSGIWAFRWVPPAGIRSLVAPTSSPAVGGWTAPGKAGLALTVGPPASWHAAGSGARGYVVAGDYWRERPGYYLATVRLSSTATVNVEVWNTTGNVLLARRSIPSTNGITQITIPVDALRAFSGHLNSGFGPFVLPPTPAPPGNDLEIRVFNPGNAVVNIFSLRIQPASAPTRSHSGTSALRTSA